MKSTKFKNKKHIIGIIGGSGLYSLEGLKKLKKKQVKTPYGKTSDNLILSTYENLQFVFLPRHGKNHTIPPHKINYKANIYALKKIGVTDLISISAVGSLKKSHKPGDFILIDQYIDRTTKRDNTYFDNKCVAHVSLAKPISSFLSNLIYKSKSKNMRIKKGGIYIAIDGPQFSTRAESLLYKSWGCDVIGMTNMPEVKLAREAEIRYASIAMVTDYDCWYDKHDAVTVEQVISIMKNNTAKVKKLLSNFFVLASKTKDWKSDDAIFSNLDSSIITDKRQLIKKNNELNKVLLARYLKGS